MEEYKDLKYKAVIFDFDGTLTDLRIEYSFLKKNLALKFKRETGARLSFTPLLGRLFYIREKYGEDFFRNFYKVVEDAELEALSSNWNFNPGMIDFIRNTDKKVAIFTLNCVKTVKAFLEKLNIHHKVDLIVSNMSIKLHKPNPEGLQLILLKFDLQCEEVVFVGNSENDFLAGKNIGIKTVILK